MLEVLREIDKSMLITLAALYELCQGRPCQVVQNDLVTATKLSRPVALKAIRKLEELGLIQVTEFTHGKKKLKNIALTPTGLEAGRLVIELAKAMGN